MNTEYILFNLREALDELQTTIEGIEQDQEYDEGQFYVEMQHVYHHLNHAWNARHKETKASFDGTETDFNKWRQFPSDMDLKANE
jgi:hypothetical protein